MESNSGDEVGNDIWLNLTVFPWLKNLTQENLLLVLNIIQSDDFDQFRRTIAHPSSLCQLFRDALKIRPSKIILFKQLFDILNSSYNLSDDDTAIFDTSYQKLCSNQYLQAMFKDDVATIRHLDIRTEDKQLSKDVMKDVCLKEKYTEGGKEDTKIIFPPILLASVLGSAKIFDYFLYSLGELKVKVDYGSDLVTTAIIGGNWQILQTLKRMNFDIVGMIFSEDENNNDAIFKYQRLDLLLYLMRDNSFDFEFLMDKAVKYNFYDLIIYFKGYPSFQQYFNELPKSSQNTIIKAICNNM